MAIPVINKDFIKGTIDSAREQIGRNVSFFTPELQGCSICLPSGYYDALSNASTYIKCPVCKGKYWTDVLTEHIILARVHWTTNEAVNMTPGGKFFIGDAYTVVDPSYHSIIQAAQSERGKVIVDGQEMQIMRINPEGAPEINRYKVILRGKGSRPE